MVLKQWVVQARRNLYMPVCECEGVRVVFFPCLDVERQETCSVVSLVWETVI